MSYPTVADAIHFLRVQKDRAIESFPLPAGTAPVSGHKERTEERVYAHQQVIQYMTGLGHLNDDEAFERTEEFIEARMQDKTSRYAQAFAVVLSEIHFLTNRK